MHVRRVAHFFDCLHAAALHSDIGIAEDRRDQLAIGADECHDIDLLRRVEVPHSGAQQSIRELESRDGHVLGRVRAGGVDGMSFDARDSADEKIEQIEAVRTKIEKQPGPADRRIDTPIRSIRAGQEWCGDLNVNRRDLTDRPVSQPIAHDFEALQRATVIRDPQRQAARLKRIDHAQALGVIECHRLLNQARLPGGCDAKRQLAMAGGRGRDVDGVDLGVLNETVGAIVDTRHAVTASVVARLLAVAAHDRNQRGTFGILKARTALDLSDVAASDDAPANRAGRRR